MFDFGRERGLNLELAPLMTSQASRENVIPARHPEECSIEGWRGRHTVILNGWRDSQDCERPPDLRMLYCPLLPNKVQPNFNPAVSGYRFQKRYNPLTDFSFPHRNLPPSILQLLRLLLGRLLTISFGNLSK